MRLLNTLLCIACASVGAVIVATHAGDDTRYLADDAIVYMGSEAPPSDTELVVVDDVLRTPAPAVELKRGMVGWSEADRAAARWQQELTRARIANATAKKSRNAKTARSGQRRQDLNQAGFRESKWTRQSRTMFERSRHYRDHEHAYERGSRPLNPRISGYNRFRVPRPSGRR